jgi:hypothetical protein
VPTPAPAGENLFTALKQLKDFIEAIKQIDWVYLLIFLAVGLLIFFVVAVILWYCCTALLKAGFCGFIKALNRFVTTLIYGKKRRRVHINGRWRDYFDEDSAGLCY